MPKNKGKYNKDKPPPPPQQELVSWSERVWSHIQPHAGKLLALIVGAAVALGGISIYNYFKEKSAAKATLAFAQAMSVVDRPVDELPEIGRIPDPEEPKYKTVQERAKAAGETLAKLIAEHGSSGPGTQALLVDAAMAYDLAQYDDAIQAYQRFLTRPSDPALRALADEGLGQAYEAKALAAADATQRNAGLDQALFAYEEIDRSEKGPLAGLSLYNQGRIHALKGNKAKAVELYKKALEKPLIASLSLDIKNRLAALEE